ncbi:hypothetical protein Caci_4020 [Catenulispora acidiphila DSM 44928]|uniref:Uncharacterized protein n=1 Tax=Catenulispora acidiphila (strain DSM 44928 / JCM 14897 / NBRC 102108 / NRRL B-24433 / ID139908) TaxID=479433 RepID=C7QEW8_CATAD|nr:hypothetical protein [Catenulispora acidiphila]ACU72888.1 hypothetical protein Caci_4020 [Catenulispora acidiphila DSM 44928]
MMTSCALAHRVAPEPLLDSAATSERYVILISGVFVRNICGAAAESTFRRWCRSPDVVMDGDLRTGFFWEWPDSRRTRIEIIPEPDEDRSVHTVVTV